MTVVGAETVYSGRIKRAQEFLASPDSADSDNFGNADQIFVTNVPDICWLTGFTGSNAALIISSEEVIFVTDGRYRTQAAEEVSSAIIRITESTLFKDSASIFGNSVLIQSDHLTLSQRKRLDELAPNTMFLVKARLFSRFRASKDNSEIELVQKALAISEKTIGACIEKIDSGITERELAAEIDYQHACFGSEGRSFETIVAFGARSALPHARPSEARLHPGDIVLIDCGCRVGGYASDITRTFLFGSDSDEIRDVYDVVLNALNSALEEARSGIRATDLDATARSVIESAGYGEFFTHSLGHGVGLDIHELPKVGKHSDDILPENAIITIEPGIYLPDRFGIRIEEMVLLTPDGGQKLNSSSTDFKLI